MRNKLVYILVFLFFQVISFKLIAQEDQANLSKSNRHCANCHGNKYYSFFNSVTEQDQRKRMNPFFIIDTVAYKQGVHREFSCEDCHASEYNTYPHAPELKLEPKFSCLDCHGGDETYAHYQFEDIEIEVDNSVHKNAFGFQFGCAQCHDLHSYKPVARNKKSLIKEIVSADNQMCLSCHNNLSKYQILTDHTKPELLSTHDWLPNQELHFMHVRCIECHTPVTDTIMVSHKILPKEKAVHLCSDCHSTNSILRGKLYKYTAKQLRSTEKGFYNSMFLNEAYVIGANRNIYLNIISLIMLGGAFIGIAIHIALRIIKKK
ncbi:MAG: cytochrome c3 family protein [Salinivirgaceae bacterium]|jgi:hypothetical protein|nr:cytochrome c3 family protein [Salinivirgaceae bacterium]